MVLQRLKPHREQLLLLAACASSRPAQAAPAAHLSRRRDRDRPVGFADVAALPDPEWSRADRTASRYSVAGLVPAGQLAAVPLAVEHEPSLDELLDEARRVMRSRDVAFEALMAERGEALAERYAALAAATWVDETIGRLIAEKACFVLDAVAARPELRHNTALLMALAPVVAMLKGLVA